MSWSEQDGPLFSSVMAAVEGSIEAKKQKKRDAASYKARR